LGDGDEGDLDRHRTLVDLVDGGIYPVDSRGNLVAVDKFIDTIQSSQSFWPEIVRLPPVEGG
jgi:hypothetical protein